MKRVFNIAIVLSLILFVSSAYADVLVPANLIARKSNDTAKESVYSWTNSDKYTCDSPVIFFFDEEEAEELCALCPNRKLIKKTAKEIGYSWYLSIYGKTYETKKSSDPEDIFYMCVSNSIKECSKDKPLLDNMGRCHACDDEEPIDISWNTYWEKNLTEVCSICSNREVISLKVGSGENYFCALKECPKEKPIRDYYGNCHACDEPKRIIEVEHQRGLFLSIKEVTANGKRKEIIYSDSSPSLICPNRNVVSSYGGRDNVLRECPFDKPLRDDIGNCYSCDEEKSISLNAELVFWGEVQSGKLYDKNSNLIGTIRDTEVKPYIDKELFKKRFIYDDNNKAVAYIKIKEEAPNISAYTDGKLSEISYSSLSIYNMDGQIMSSRSGTRTIYVDESKNKDFFDGSYYFIGVMPDDVCKNREIISDEGRGKGLYSRLQKCPTDMPIRYSDGSCIAKDDKRNNSKGCRDDWDWPMSDYYGRCFGCNTTDAVQIGVKRGNREIEYREGYLKNIELCEKNRKMVNGYSILKRCPFGMIRAEDGSCYTPGQLARITKADIQSFSWIYHFAFILVVVLFFVINFLFYYFLKKTKGKKIAFLFDFLAGLLTFNLVAIFFFYTNGKGFEISQSLTFIFFICPIFIALVSCLLLAFEKTRKLSLYTFISNILSLIILLLLVIYSHQHLGDVWRYFLFFLKS